MTRSALILLISFVVFIDDLPSAWADDGRVEEALGAWAGHILEEEVRELRESFGIVLVAPEGAADPVAWHPEEVASLRAGAMSVPAGVWDSLGRPVFVERSSKTCLFGLGRYNRSCPSFDRNKETFYLYEIPAIQGEGSLEILALLTAAEQRDLQRRRAMVHLAISLADEEKGWSKGRAWRSINGWPRGRGAPLNLDVWGYSRYLGMRSAHLDLVTFAEEYFVRPEDLLSSSQDGDAQHRLARLDPNHTLGCQQFTKSRILRRSIAEVASDWEEPVRRLPMHEQGTALCPEFELWANYANLDGIDILLAAATSRPQSLYGHLLLHVRYRSDGKVASEGFEPVYQFGAVTDSDINPIDFFARGLMGGFSSVLEHNTFRGIDRLFLQFEQRALRRYALNLNPGQSLQLLERIWEAERRIIYPYAFFTKNCASFIIDLIEPALDMKFPERGSRLVAPTDVLDYLADQDNAELGPLLTKRSDDLLSTRERAQDAVRTRRRIFGEFLQESATSKEEARPLRAWLERLDETKPEDRAQAYEALRPLLFERIESSPQASLLAIDFLYYSVRIERYFMEVAHYGRREVYAGAHLEPFRMSAEEQLELRRSLYGHEDQEERTAARNHWATMTDERLRNAPRREFTREERDIIALEGRTRKVYLAALDLQATLIERFHPDWSGVDFLAQKSEEFERGIWERDNLSKQPSGKNRLVLGLGGLTSTPGEAWASLPVIDLSYSFMYDRLGELRRRGYRGDLESRAFGLDLKVPLSADAARNISAEGVLFRYISLEQKAGPIRASRRDGFGWGTDVRVRHDGRRDLYFGGELTGGLLFPLLLSRHGVNHLVAGVGLQARYDVAPTNHVLGGPEAKLLGQVHLYGHYANVMRLELRTAQLLSYPVAWHQEYVGQWSTEHALFHVGQRQLILSPRVELFWTTLDYRGEGEARVFSQWQGSLRVELPF
ncbi:MAG: DUF4105 domain-containing protein [Bradymonadaceae bacterium]